LVVGGGDSVLPIWTLNLQPVAKSVTLVHRPDFALHLEQSGKQVFAMRIERGQNQLSPRSAGYGPEGR